MTNIVAFSGSARSGSFNQKLVQIAAKGAEAAGATVRVLNLADFPMPIFNEDLEAVSGMPPEARAFKEELIAADGFLIASPEYNSSISPLLKNAIDWASRREGDEAPLLAYRGKAATLMACSPGGLGGLRGLVILRSLLCNIGMIVLPDQRAVGRAHETFADDGTLKDSEEQAAIEELGGGLADFLATQSAG